MKYLEKTWNWLSDKFGEYISPDFLGTTIYTILIVLGAFLAIYLLRGVFRYIYRRYEFSRDHFTHLRITLPRNDSKLDNEKRTDKDFHEAIGKAEQFFRSLHETKDLNLYNQIFKHFLWKKPQLSFELQFENQKLWFVIVCDKYYQKIIQKQVTSFYQSAEIEILNKEERFELKPKGNHINGFYMHTKKEHHYPIQTYKEIEDDALNTIANSFSKLDENEKGVIQMIIHPVSNRWQKKTAEFGTLLFKGKDADGFWLWKLPVIGPVLMVVTWPLKIILYPFKILIKGYDPAEDGGSNAPGASGGDSYVRMLESKEKVAKSVGEKANLSGFETVIRVFASSPKKHRVQTILNGLFVAFNVFKGKGSNRFENRRIIPINILNQAIIRHNYNYRLPAFLEKSCLLASNELATVYHFPDARYNKIPTIKWLSYKVLAPPINLPKEGIILGKSVYRGVEKYIRVLREDRTRHMYFIGKSGSGKSVLLWNMAIQDIANGEGVCVLDPHGDLIEDCAACIPKERAKDVILFDPGDKERPMGLNLLETKNPDERDRASLDAMQIFIKLFGNEIFGPRIQHYFRNGCLTLMADEEEGATLIDIPRLFIDEDFQKYKVTKVKNPVVRDFWENEIANTGDREKQEMIPYFTSKFGPFVSNTIMRNIIGQTKSAFDIREVMDSGKILLINLSKGKIGDINAQLLGMIIVSKINMAAMARADMPKEERKDFYFYVDEFQNFATDTFASILSEARKYRLNLIMAHQYIAQLSEGAGGISIGQKDSKLKAAVFGNVGSMASFKVGAEDAEYLEKEYAPELSQQDIAGISNYKAYIKLNIENSTSRPFSMETLYDPDLKNKKVLEIVKKYSRMKYGRKKVFVDAEIEARMGLNNLSAINKAAKADPTVNDDLLKEGTNAKTEEVQKVNTADIPAVAKAAPPSESKQISGAIDSLGQPNPATSQPLPTTEPKPANIPVQNNPAPVTLTMENPEQAIVDNKTVAPAPVESNPAPVTLTMKTREQPVVAKPEPIAVTVPTQPVVKPEPQSVVFEQKQPIAENTPVKSEPTAIFPKEPQPVVAKPEPVAVITPVQPETTPAVPTVETPKTE